MDKEIRPEDDANYSTCSSKSKSTLASQASHNVLLRSLAVKLLMSHLDD